MDNVFTAGEAILPPEFREFRELIPPVTTRLRALVPGASLVVVVALAASWLSENYGAPVMLFALLLGIALNFSSREEICKAGINFSARTVLRLGVALLGARITLGQVESLGVIVLLVVTLGVILTIVSGCVLARRLRLPVDVGILTGVSVAICGASAAMAIASILPKSPTVERDTVMTVVGVTTLSTIAMVVYPVLTQTFGLNDNAAGIFLGATIHDVAQVVGAGYSLSKHVGDTATLVKLFRVALLVPTVILISTLIFHTTGAASPSVRRVQIPGFLLGFACLVLINSAGFEGKVVMEWLGVASRWCLIIAIAALGTKTSLGDFVHVGWRPILLIVTETAVVSAFILIAVLLHIAG